LVLLPGDIILNGSLLAAIPLAALAGLVSFLSPCILPLVPGYLGYVSGTAAAKSRVVLGVSLFVLGFTAVFVALGAAAGSVSVWLIGTAGNVVFRILGAVIILFGLVMIGQFSWFQKTIRFGFTPRLGLIGAPLLGVAFALGWTPCVGPTLSAVLALSAQSGSPLRGAILTVAYSLGIGLPFLAIAAGFGWATKSVGFVRRHIRAFNVSGGILLILLGLLMLSGLWNTVISYFQELSSGYLPAL